MLVFSKGTWIEVAMPSYVDPSWTYGDRMKAASVVADLLGTGVTFKEAWVKAEEAVYAELGVSRKQHGAPQNEKKDDGVKEES